MTDKNGLVEMYWHAGLCRLAFDVPANAVTVVQRNCPRVMHVGGTTFIIRPGNDSHTTYEHLLQTVDTFVNGGQS